MEELVNGEFTERQMWIAIRAAILSIAKAIENFACGALAMDTRAGLLAIADAIARRWGLRNSKAN
jgi:hypothetical protein